MWQYNTNTKSVKTDSHSSFLIKNDLPVSSLRWGARSPKVFWLEHARGCRTQWILLRHRWSRPHLDRVDDLHNPKHHLDPRGRRHLTMRQPSPCEESYSGHYWERCSHLSSDILFCCCEPNEHQCAFRWLHYLMKGEFPLDLQLGDRSKSGPQGRSKPAENDIELKLTLKLLFLKYEGFKTSRTSWPITSAWKSCSTIIANRCSLGIILKRRSDFLRRNMIDMPGMQLRELVVLNFVCLY